MHPCSVDKAGERYKIPGAFGASKAMDAFIFVRENAMFSAVQRITAISLSIFFLFVGASLALAQKYDKGASDTEIKIGNIMPYSGPLSAYALIGRTEAAYFNKINAEGGVNGRKINFITYDDAFSPPKTVEQARKLVESDEVLLIFQSLEHRPTMPFGNI
jgi:ABC-type branched-subunit amino acid transport system substrate-binding protein